MHFEKFNYLGNIMIEELLNGLSLERIQTPIGIIFIGITITLFIIWYDWEEIKLILTKDDD